jgi:AsmA family/AsmA-like C-terminal region
VKVFSSKRRVVVFVAVLVLLLFLLRPGASRLKSRIAGSLSAALGRSVEIGSVHLRLLPRPGFDLENLVVYDDPAFGSEPMLRSADVTASLRLTSLVRGRLEIARLDLTEPSLNLVQGENGRWNLEALLERSARIPLAPTAKVKSEPRPGFPYVEASSARINFKRGPEKMPYALTSADFSLWQDSENAWGVRLQAQPFRSDLNLNDMGLVRISGTWQRAASLRDTPLEFSLEWDRPQLGQLTKFFTGRDSGWRGSVRFDAVLSGTPAKLKISTDSSVLDFRRYDITNGEPLRLAAHCDGEYSSVDKTFHQVLCDVPVGEGRITLKGEIGLPGGHRSALQLSVDEVPASAAVALVQHAKKGLPSDLAAGGKIHGRFSMGESEADSGAQFSGQGEISEFRMASAKSKSAIGPQAVPFTLKTGLSPLTEPMKTGHGLSSHLPGRRNPNPYLEVGPFPVGLQDGVPAKARGWFDRSSYRISINGEAKVAKALSVGRMVGLAAISAPAEGQAQLDLVIAGSWAGQRSTGGSEFVPPQITGTVKLREVRVGMRGIDEPIEISRADLELAPDGVRVTKLSAHAANSVWTGSFDLPRGCGTPDACAIQFNLSADDLSLADFSEWVNPRAQSAPWYGVWKSGRAASPSVWMNLRAAGRLSANRLLIRGFGATQVSANVTLDSGKLHISEVAADFLGGRYRGDWKADFGIKPATYSGTGSFTGVALAQMTEQSKSVWSGGTGDGTYQMKASAVPAEFWQSADGSLRFDVHGTSMPGVALVEDAGPLKVTSFTGSARLHAGKMEISEALLASSAGKFNVSGTASLARELDLKLTRRSGSSKSGGFTIAGTLDDPHVSAAAAPETQAQLKPEPSK